MSYVEHISGQKCFWCEQVRAKRAVGVKTVWCETMAGFSRNDVGIYIKAVSSKKVRRERLRAKRYLVQKVCLRVGCSD